AEKALEKEEYEKAAGYVDGAINACRDTITSLKGELRSPIKIDYVKIIMGILLACSLIWLSMELWHGRIRKSGRREDKQTKEIGKSSKSNR
ncbi:hypothetical protein J4401_01515, partial [Candidatus Woesearchaeota archaeon]|nr:hypothetical protein [Candidatus Woesearchaeota archaeon]